MPRQTRPPQGLFAERLDHLFRTAHPKDRGPYTPAEAAEAINSAAGQRVVSGTYLWLLRTGERDNPTLRHLIAIARFFAVPPTYFFPDDTLGENALPAELTAALGDAQVRAMALRAADLSDPRPPYFRPGRNGPESARQGRLTGDETRRDQQERRSLTSCWSPSGTAWRRPPGTG